MLSPEFIEKAKLVKMIIFDVDGVMTDGRIYVDDRGLEIKAFHVLDGNGIKLLQKSQYRSCSDFGTQCARCGFSHGISGD